MKRFLAILVTLLTAFVSKAQGQESISQQLPMMHMVGILGLVETIPLPGDGYMDHLAVDVKGQRLFVSGEAAKSLIVVDLRAGKVIHETKGLSAMPKKPFYLPETDEVWMTLTDSSVVAISGTTYEVIKTVKLSGYGDPNRGADNAAYDPASHLIYAGVEVFENFGGSGQHGSTDASIDIVDTKTATLVGSIKLPGGDPAGIAIEPSGKRLYVTMGDIVDGESHVAVVDLEKRGVIAQWPITGGPVPHTAGLDAAHHRLFVGSRTIAHTGNIGGGHQREPGKLVVINTETGKVAQVLDSVGGADDLQYDAATGRIYFVGTTGTVAVFKEVDPDHFQLLGKVPTGAISKTGLWVPELKRFYSAVPRHYVLTARHGTQDFQGDLLKELNIAQGVTAREKKSGWQTSMLSDLVIEEAHLMVFDYVP
ncbi:MAG: Pyrrolo-quinoline quinone beta-propeller repeat-containing protein [Candidatus Acidoferrum typicum]|nr:Pyrrolo-quinoline quinone beta-propeller repeat-containing protein [Candidatus Acidoferrum typicum]